MNAFDLNSKKNFAFLKNPPPTQKILKKGPSPDGALLFLKKCPGTFPEPQKSAWASKPHGRFFPSIPLKKRQNWVGHPWPKVSKMLSGHESWPKKSQTSRCFFEPGFSLILPLSIFLIKRPASGNVFPLPGYSLGFGASELGTKSQPAANCFGRKQPFLGLESKMKILPLGCIITTAE